MNEAMDLSRRVAACLVLVAGVMCGPTLLAQAVGADTLRAASGTGNEWGSAMIWAYFSSAALEWMKRSPRVTLFAEQASFAAQRAMGIVIAVAASVGVGYTYDAHAGVLTITGLTAAGIGAVVVDALRQFVMQELIYRTAVKHHGAPRA